MDHPISQAMAYAMQSQNAVQPLSVEEIKKEELGALKARALRVLISVDHVDHKALDEGLTVSASWRAWRSQLREVVRGERLEIPPEPERYNAP